MVPYPPARFILLCALILFLHATGAQAKGILLPPDVEKIEITPHAQIMEDPGGELSVAQAAGSARNGQYRPVGPEPMGLGFSESTFWLRFRIGAGQPGDWVFVPSWIPVDDTSMYMVRRAGGAVLYTELEKLDQGAFKLPRNSSNAWFYLKIRDPLGVYLTLDLVRDTPFHGWSTDRAMLLGVFFGILLGLTAYSLSMYGALRDPGHGWFVSYMVCITTYFALFTGSLPVPPAWRDYGVLILAGSGLAALGQFSRAFLMTRTRSRILDALFMVYMTASAGCCAAIPFVARADISDALSLTSIAALTVNLIAGTTTWIRGFKPARYYVLAEAQAALALGWYLSTLQGLIPPSPYGFVVILAATALETVLMSLALAERITVLKREREALDAASKAKSEFLASISHELRTPMNLVMGMAESLGRTELSPKQRKLVNTLTGAGKGLVALISNLLDIAKIEAGRTDLDLAPFDVSALCSRMMDMFSGRAGDKGVELKLTLDSQAAGVRLGDGFKLEQVLINLIGNAVKFTSKGRIELTVEALDQTRVRFTVRDTGMGIPKSRQRAVFERFTQAGPKVRERFGGSGLGLAISKRLVNMMGGDILLSSRVGKGSEFVFGLDLPRTDEEPLTVVDAMDAGRALMSMPRAKVLVVDDVEANLELIKLYLEDLPVEVDQCSSGTHAVEKFKKNEYQAVIMDVMMDMVDGREAATAMRRLEKSSGRKRTPMIAVSAAAFDSDKEMSREAGFDMHLSKPLPRAVLLAAMAELMLPDGAVKKGTPYTAMVEPHFAPLMPKIRASFEKMAKDALEKSRAGDADGLARAGHAIKGAGLNFGIERAAEMGESLQKLGEEGNTAKGGAMALDLLEWAENLVLEAGGGSAE